MASLSDLYIKVETLEILLKTVKQKGLKGLSITIALNDEQNNYNQNVSGYVSQNKEERAAKKQKYYIGNGKTVWSNGNQPSFNQASQQTQAAPAQKPQPASTTQPEPFEVKESDGDGLPF